MRNICNYFQIICMLSLFEPQRVMLKMNSNNNKINEYPVPRVVNGYEATLGQFPYQVGLKRRKPHQKTFYTFCGGALIGKNKVLTAAHCVETTTTNKRFLEEHCSCLPSKSIHTKYVVAATLLNDERFEENSESQWREIHKAHTPKGYSFPKQDIAVVLTKEPFVFDQYVNSLPFATVYVDYGDRKCTVSGYGKVSYTARSTNLLWAKLDLLSSELCDEKHNRNMSDYICTSSKLTDVLEGDSGGPLVCFNSSDPQEGDKGVIVGLVSGSHSLYGTFFTRVSSYRDFIESAKLMNKSTNCNIGMTYYLALISLKLNFVLF